MSFPEIVVRAAIEAVATVLPISASAHRAVVRLWLGDDPTAFAVRLAAWTGCLAALVVGGWAPLRQAAASLPSWLRQPPLAWRGEAGRTAVVLLLAAGCSTLVRLLVAAGVTKLAAEPVVVGAGLCATAVTLASTLAASPGAERVPGLLGALGVGAAHGLATAPGGSQIGAAYVVLCWLGIRGWRAVELSLALGALCLAVELVTGAASASALGPLWSWSSLVALGVAALTGLLAALVWRLLASGDRTTLLLAWIVPLAVALLAFAHALAGPAA